MEVEEEKDLKQEGNVLEEEGDHISLSLSLSLSLSFLFHFIIQVECLPSEPFSETHVGYY